MAEIELFRVQVRVGKHWVPAHLGDVDEVGARRLCSAYRVDRPSADVRVVPVERGAVDA